MGEFLKITSKNFDASKEVLDYIEKKIGKINKYSHKITSIQVVLTKNKYFYNVEILVSSPYEKIIKITETDKDIFACIEKAIDKVEDVIVKYKEKITSKKDRKRFFEIDEIAEQPYKKISLNIKKFDEKTAMEEFSRSNSNFLVFYNKESNKFSIIRKDEDGEIEILECSID